MMHHLEQVGDKMEYVCMTCQGGKKVPLLTPLQVERLRGRAREMIMSGVHFPSLDVATLNLVASAYNIAIDELISKSQDAVPE